MDAMVTGRMSPAKKEQGTRVLNELGTNASQAINALYDYVIAHRALPFPDAGKQRGQSELLRASLRLVDSIPKVTLDEHYASMTTKDARRERLSGHGPDGTPPSNRGIA